MLLRAAASGSRSLRACRGTLASRRLPLTGARMLSTRPLPGMDDIRSFSAPELEAARLQLSQAIEVEPSVEERAALQRLLGATHLRLGAPLDAEAPLEDALAASDEGTPGHTETRFLLGVCYQKSARPDEAMTEFEAVIAEDDEHWRARFHMALMAVAEGLYDEAEQMLHDVFEINPSHADTIAILEKLEERRAAENNKLVPPGADEADPDQVGGRTFKIEVPRK